MMKNDLFVEIAYQGINCHGDRICGDNFIQRHIPNQNRTVAVLSDGMGHGVKANILSTLTSSIIASMVEDSEDIRHIAQTVLKTLPVCSVRKISYSTFTIFDFHHNDNMVHIVEYDNPPVSIVRNGKIFEPESQTIEISEDLTITNRRKISLKTFEAQPHDVIVFCSDGVTQSGIGEKSMPFGWGNPKLRDFILKNISAEECTSTKQLAVNVVNQAVAIDGNRPKDDISCVAIRLRRPKKLLFCSCPPTIERKSREVAEAINNFDGTTAISGYPLAELVGREFGVEIIKNPTSADPDVPPTWNIKGVDMVTEGLITLGKVLDILEKQHGQEVMGKGGAYELCRIMMNADIIEMIIGLKERVDTPTVWGDDYVLRRKVLRAIAEIIESKFNKQVKIQYL